MARFDLHAILRRAKNPQHRTIVMRNIKTTGVQAQSLYRAIYAPVVLAWSEAAAAILEEYRRSLSTVTRDSAVDMGAILRSTDNELTRLFLQIRPALNRWAILTELWHRGLWRGAVLTATGVDLNTMIGAEGARETLETAIERNVALVKSVSDQVRARISDAVFRGLTQRRPAVYVAKEVQEAVAMTRRRAINIASDQMTKISAALDQERRREAGIDEWKWRHSGKVHARPEHLERDDEIYSDTTAPEDMPGELPFCGCTSQAVLRFD